MESMKLTTLSHSLWRREEGRQPGLWKPCVFTVVTCRGSVESAFKPHSVLPQWLLDTSSLSGLFTCVKCGVVLTRLSALQFSKQRMQNCHASFYPYWGILFLVNLSRLTMNLTISFPHDVWSPFSPQESHKLLSKSPQEFLLACSTEL